MPSLSLLENQGFSNTNYILKTTKKNYIIKVFGAHCIDRNMEFNIAFEAYKKGIGSKPIYYDESFMICEFIEGVHKTKLKKLDIKNIALLLKRLHGIKINKRVFNRKKDHVLCHHDLNPKNFIFSDSIKLIDWEYARYNDPYFDLATVVVEFKLNKTKEKWLLEYYFKNPYIINKKKLYFFKKSYIKLRKQWFKNIEI